MASIDDRWYRRGPRGRVEPSARHGHGMRWRVRYVDPAGRERGKSFARKADAEKFKATTEADLIRGTWADPSKGRVLLQEYAADWLASRHGEPSTLETLRNRVLLHIIPALGELPLRDIRPSRVQAFITGLHLAPTTVRGILTTLSAILSAAVDDEILTSNPCRKASVKAPKVIPSRVVPWTASMVTDIRAALPARWQVLCDLGAGLGVRQGEAFGLAVDDIDFLRRVVRVRCQVRVDGGTLVLAPTKGGRERDVPLADWVAQALAAHLQQFPAREVVLPWRISGGPQRRARLILTTSLGNAIHRGTFNDSWRAALRAAGITPSSGTGTHALRHRFASVLLAGGVDVKTLAEYMGHSDASITLRTYSHLMPNAADRARRAIEEAFAAEDQPSGHWRESYDS
jgi:integrase